MHTRIFILLLLTGMLGSVHAGVLSVHVLDTQSKALAETVVLVRPVNTDEIVKIALEPAVIDQVDKEFVARVRVFPVGTAVRFPNKDNIRHQVYSFSSAKNFELPLYSGTPAEPVVFDKVGIVKLGCNIHDWMTAYVYITDAPYFAVTGDDGAISFDELPEGEYELTVWHARAKSDEEQSRKLVSVNRDGASEISWQLDLKPNFRPRRAPLRVGGGYR